jgi:SAM-dependent methyltransferase
MSLMPNHSSNHSPAQAMELLLEQAATHLNNWEELMLAYSPGRNSAFQLSAELLFGLLPVADSSGLRVADLGCGFGGWSQFIQTKAKKRNISLELIGIDASEQRLKVYQTVLGERAQILQGNMLETLPLLAKSERVCAFDAVIFGWTAHELEPSHLGQVYQQLHKMLKPSGILLMVDFVAGLSLQIEVLNQQLTQKRLEPKQGLDDAAKKHAHTHSSGQHGHKQHYSLQEHQHFLEQAGFAQAEEVWRYLNSCMVLALNA